jgi:hypothetical protein
MSERRESPWDPQDPWDSHGKGNENLNETGMGMGMTRREWEKDSSRKKGKKEINNTLLSNTMFLLVL